MAEKPAFAFDAAAIARERTIRSNHAVARYYNANRIGTVGQAHRPDGIWTADSPCERGVRNCRATGNSPQRLPHLALKRGAGSLHRQGVDCGQVASKVTPDCLG